jgi:Family of unknown function (DUF6099)
MDAVRLIDAGHEALMSCGRAIDVVAESWQAQALALAIGERLAAGVPPGLRAAARELAEAGARGCGGGDPRAPGAPVVPRARGLTRVGDAVTALLALDALLDEVGAALVGVAMAAEDEALYWSCVESIDAADETGDRIRVLLRGPWPGEREGPPRAGAADTEAGARPPGGQGP